MKTLRPISSPTKIEGFDDKLRLHVCWSTLDLQVLEDLLRTREEFEAARATARELAKQAPKVGSKKFDKSPW